MHPMDENRAEDSTVVRHGGLRFRAQVRHWQHLLFVFFVMSAIKNVKKMYYM